MVDINQVLETVNKLRTAVGLEAIADLPEGEQLSCSDCPVVRALDDCDKFPVVVGTDELVVMQDTPSASIDSIIQNTWGERVNDMTTLIYEYHRFKNPQIITDFINEFDRGLWPQYIVDEETE